MRMSRAILCGGAAVLALTQSGCDRMKPGRMAPGLMRPDLQGRSLAVSSLRGKVVLVGFFSTWAPPCRLAMLTWARHLRTWGRRGLTVVGAALEEGRAGVPRGRG